jgi:uncharacterized membrane protein
MKMGEVLVEGCIYEVYFRYTDKLEGYPTLMSHINELSKIGKQQMI